MGRRRYRVEPCDNGDSLGVPGVDPDAPPRSVTWLIWDRTKDRQVDEFHRRSDARAEARRLNAKGDE